MLIRKKTKYEMMRDELAAYYHDILGKQNLDDTDNMSSEISRMTNKRIASMNEAEIEHLYHKIFNRWHPVEL